MNRILALTLMTLSSSCARTTVIHDVDERQANRIVVLLQSHGIAAHKHRVESGRNVAYSVAVPSRHEVRAMEVTSAHQYPRKPAPGYEALVEDDSIIPTAQEEQIRKVMALEGEIEQLLGVHRGILEVEANVTFPEERDILTSGTAAKPRTASVSVVYLPGAKREKPLSSVQIQALVATSVDGLEPANVTVMMSQASVPEVPIPDPGPGLTLRQERYVFIGIGAVMILLCLIAIYAQLRLRSVRKRLMRLQVEIKKARGPERKVA